MSGPLAGLKVLDFSTLLPGPYASMLMADMGAEVLKIESPERHDMVHSLQPGVTVNGFETSYAHLTLNRNKRSLTLDLKKPEAVQIIKQLAKEYDVIIEQFRPGVMNKLGLSYSVLSEINPQLIYCSITGYGQQGPLSHKAGHDINYLALSGLASYSGRKETGPVLSGTQIADIAGGSQHAVMSILAAVIARQNGNKGQWLDISMTDAAFSLNAMFGAGALGNNQSPQTGATLLNGGGFYDYYQTSDNRYLSVGSLEPKFAKAFFQLLQQPHWFARSMKQNLHSQQQLKTDIAALLKQKTLSQWMEIFSDNDLCVEPVLTVTEAAESQLMKQRQMTLEAQIGDSGIKQIAPVVKFAGHQPKVIPAPVPGQHSQEVLTSLGLTATQINQLMDTTDE